MAKSRKEASREKKIYNNFYINKQNKGTITKRKKGKERKGRGKRKKALQTQHILFVGNLVTAMPVKDEQTI